MKRLGLTIATVLWISLVAVMAQVTDTTGLSNDAATQEQTDQYNTDQEPQGSDELRNDQDPNSTVPYDSASQESPADNSDGSQGIRSETETDDMEGTDGTNDAGSTLDDSGSGTTGTETTPGTTGTQTE